MTPGNDNDDLVYGKMSYSFDELIAALEANGAEVERGLITDEGEFVVQAND